MSVYGIDLGTTYSCIAAIDGNGNPKVIQNQADASDLLASAAFFESEDNVVIGEAAKASIETDGDRVVQFAKREIGKENGKTWTFFGKNYNPVEISALLLMRMKDYAKEQGEDVKQVVITCPAYFDFLQRDATRKAGEAAGFEVLNLINEPTAAALNYCARQFQEDKTVLVYDLGGGTFDVSLIKLSVRTAEDGKEHTAVQILYSDGNPELGGKDWDEALKAHILDRFITESGFTRDDIDLETMQVIDSKVELAKKKLSTAESTKVKIPFNGVMTTIEVTREQFNSLTAGLLNQTLAYVDVVLKKASDLGVTDIDTVLMVGGSTFMPMVFDAMNEKFPGKVQREEPNLAVAKGAALYATLLVDPEPEPIPDPVPEPIPDPVPGTIPDPVPDHDKEGGSISTKPPIELEGDILPRSFGLGVLNVAGEYVIDNLLKINSKMPAHVEKRYSTPIDNMAKIVIRVFESRSEKDEEIPCIDAQGNDQPTDPSLAVQYLGELSMPVSAGMPKGAPIDVTFHIEAGGIYVKAISLNTGEEKDCTLEFKIDQEVKETSSIFTLQRSGE